MILIKIFDIDNLYLDWFKSKFRFVRQSELLKTESLSTTYLTLQPIYKDERRSIVGYGEATYRSYKFPLHNFLEFTGYEKTNYYQLIQLKEFIESLIDIPSFTRIIIAVENYSLLLMLKKKIIPGMLF